MRLPGLRVGGGQLGIKYAKFGGPRRGRREGGGRTLSAIRH